MVFKTIVIYPQTKQKLDQLKVNPRQSYDHLINEIISVYTQHVHGKKIKEAINHKQPIH